MAPENTPAGKWFDIVLIACILLSVTTVMLDSVAGIRAEYNKLLYAAEWFFTILFTIEYILRLLCIGRPVRYAVSFFGAVDLLAILPTYVSLLFFGSSYLLVVRVLRGLRIFRVLKLGHHTKEAVVLKNALYASRRKILVFLCVVLTLVVIIGALMDVIEEADNGFTSIPRSVYWTFSTNSPASWIRKTERPTAPRSWSTDRATPNGRIFSAPNTKLSGRKRKITDDP